LGSWRVLRSRTKSETEEAVVEKPDTGFKKNIRPMDIRWCSATRRAMTGCDPIYSYLQ
jgi:hypothetical protein